MQTSGKDLGAYTIIGEDVWLLYSSSNESEFVFFISC